MYIHRKWEVSVRPFQNYGPHINATIGYRIDTISASRANIARRQPFENSHIALRHWSIKALLFLYPRKHIRALLFMMAKYL